MHSSDKIELEKRIRIVQEWIIEDWPTCDIITQCVTKWKISDRQAKRYIKTAKDRWADQEQEKLDRKRKLKIETLKKLKRSLKSEFTGTPKGIRAILAVEKEIIDLEAIRPSIKVEHSGPGGKPIPIETTHTVVFEDYAK